MKTGFFTTHGQHAAAGDGQWECNICWQVYDPAAGDEQAQIPPGTAFADLPEHWRCPQCDSPKQGFLPGGT